MIMCLKFLFVNQIANNNYIHKNFFLIQGKLNARPHGLGMQARLGFKKLPNSYVTSVIVYIITHIKLHIKILAIGACG